MYNHLIFIIVPVSKAPGTASGLAIITIYVNNN